jgi:putative transposase
MLEKYMHFSKNLYNFANYQIRQHFFKTGEYLPYNELCKLLRQPGKDKDYKSMPTAQSAQQTLKLLDQNWKSFFEAMKAWRENPEKFTGRPKPPKYLDKDGTYVIILTNQNCSLIRNTIHFSKSFNKFRIKTKVFRDFNQIRFVPGNRQIIVEVIYEVETPSKKPDNGRYLGIDLGLDNFATIVNNVGEKPIVINGKGLKSINQYYNKLISHYQKVAKQMNSKDKTNRIYKITNKRNNIIENFMLKASKFTVQKALKLNCNTIIIGYNKNWKQDINLGKVNNQKFVQIQYRSFINKLKYKAENYGIRVIEVEESYTSKCSFLDLEEICEHEQYKGKRIERGLFKASDGTLINADVNAAYNILRKVFPNAFAEGIEGVGLHPVRVNVVNLR